MTINEISSGIRFELKNIALLRFLQNSEYINIISPYSRMYLVTEGNGHIVFGNNTIPLQQGFLYFIPSFVHCSYFFGKNLAHIYIHFSAILENGLPIYNLISFQNRIRSIELSKMLFFRLLELNPGLELPHHDPLVYQKKPWMEKKPCYNCLSQKYESEAIIQQLLAGFILKKQEFNVATHLKYNIHKVLSFVQQNLNNDIKMDQLAGISCLSKDHFTKIFKQVLGVPPCEFIIRKRIEKSQYLLLTTDYPIHRIIEETNFKNAPYFSRMFKRYTSYTPAEYRKLGLQNP